MASQDIPGFLVTLTLDGNVITALCTNLGLERSKASMKKSVMDGTGSPTFLPGEETGAFAIIGSVIEGATNIEALETTWSKAVEVPFIIDVGDGATIEAGIYTGDTLLNEFNIATDPADTWTFDINGDTGKITYTAPTP
jgi:hypothetical protein